MLPEIPTTIVENGETDTYSYDSRNRLIKVCYGTSCADGSITYAYDAAGNRTSMTNGAGTTTTYSYNAANELTSTSGPGGTTNYSYDANGRQTAAGSTTYQWNAADEIDVDHRHRWNYHVHIRWRRKPSFDHQWLQHHKLLLRRQ